MKYKWTQNYTQITEPVQSINEKTEGMAFGLRAAPGHRPERADSDAGNQASISMIS
jgi:hypothetical protein